MAIVEFGFAMNMVVKDVTEKILAETIVVIYPLDSLDSGIEVAVVGFGAPLIGVVKDVAAKVVVGLEESVVSDSGTVFVVLMRFPAFVTQ